MTPILRAAVISVCALLGRFHPPHSFAKPPPLFSVCDSGHTNRSGHFVFEFQDVVAVWRKPRTGTFITSSEPELRSSCDISQWTDRYWIRLSRGWPFAVPVCCHMNFTLAISTRSHDSSAHVSTLRVPDKVHAVPFTRKL